MDGPSIGDLALRWRVDPAALIAVAAAAALYARAAARHPRRWPAARSAAWFAGLALVVVATQSGISRFESSWFSVHMVQHVLLGMAAPLLLVLGAPVTLALQGGGPGTRRVLRRALHSPPGRALAHPLTGWCLFGGGLVVLYLTPLLDVAARHDAVHLAVHAHVVASGWLFLLPIAGVDALPRPVPFAGRLLALLVAVPFHAFLGAVLWSAGEPVAPDAYPDLDDQRVAAAILWASGEVMTLAVAAVVFSRWLAYDRRHAARLDRSSIPADDRLEDAADDHREQEPDGEGEADGGYHDADDASGTGRQPATPATLRRSRR